MIFKKGNHKFKKDGEEYNFCVICGYGAVYGRSVYDECKTLSFKHIYAEIEDLFPGKQGYKCEKCKWYLGEEKYKNNSKIRVYYKYDYGTNKNIACLEVDSEGYFDFGCHIKGETRAEKMIKEILK